MIAPVLPARLTSRAANLASLASPYNPAIIVAIFLLITVNLGILATVWYVFVRHGRRRRFEPQRDPSLAPPILNVNNSSTAHIPLPERSQLRSLEIRNASPRQHSTESGRDLRGRGGAGSRDGGGSPEMPTTPTPVRVRVRSGGRVATPPDLDTIAEVHQNGFHTPEENEKASYGRVNASIEGKGKGKAKERLDVEREQEHLDVSRPNSEHEEATTGTRHDIGASLSDWESALPTNTADGNNTATASSSGNREPARTTAVFTGANNTTVTQSSNQETSRVINTTAAGTLDTRLELDNPELFGPARLLYLSPPPSSPTPINRESARSPDPTATATTSITAATNRYQQPLPGSSSLFKLNPSRNIRLPAPNPNRAPATKQRHPKPSRRIGV